MTKRKTIRGRILDSLKIPTQEEIEARITSAYNSGYKERAELDSRRPISSPRTIKARVVEAYNPDDPGGNDDPATSQFAAGGQGYRAMTGGIREPAISFDQNLATAAQLRESNPLIDRIGEIRRDYIIGQGIQPKAADPELQEILDAFWKDNAMPTFISELARQWSDYGAQVVPAFVRKADGAVSLGYIDPSLIDRVIPHPDNSRRMMAVVTRPQQSQDVWVPDSKQKVYRIIQQDEAIEVGEEVLKARHKGKLVTHYQGRIAGWETAMLEAFGLEEYSGDVFYVTKNADSNQPIGRSDHLQVADTVDQNDAALFAVGEREELANMIIVDVSVDGDADAVRTRAREIRETPPEPGSVNVHNTSEVWDMNSPTLNQTSSVATVDAQRAQIIGGEGFPVAWFGTPQGAHLATAQAQGDPTWRTLKHDQGIMQAWFERMLEFARDQAMIAGYYTPEEETDTSVTLPMPPMTVKDVAGIAASLSAVVMSSVTAVQEGLVTREAAIDAVAKVYSELDVDVDTDTLKDDLANKQQTATLVGGDLFDNKKDWDRVHPVLEVRE